MKGIGRAAKTQNSSNKKEKTRQKIRKIRAIEKRCCYPVSPGCGGGDFTERRVEGEISALGSDHATCCRSPDGIRLWGRRAYTISINYFILLSMQWMVYFPFSTNSIDMFSWAKKWMNSLEKAPGPLVLFLSLNSSMVAASRCLSFIRTGPMLVLRYLPLLFLGQIIRFATVGSRCCRHWIQHGMLTFLVTERYRAKLFESSPQFSMKNVQSIAIQIVFVKLTRANA